MSGSRTRPPRAVVIVLVLAVFGAAGYLWWRTRTTEDDGRIAASGVVEAKDYQVAATIAGSVSQLLVTEGATVSAGQVLVRLDSRALKLHVDQASQGVVAARAALDNAEDDGTSADVVAARARVAQARAALELARVQQGYATLTAPHAGRVVTVTTNVGQAASPARSLLTITDPTDLFVRVFVPETEVGNVRVGQAVTARPDATSVSYRGIVSFVASTSEFTPNSVQTRDQRAKLVYEVRVRVTDPSGVLKPGLPVDVTFG